ncbi:MAG: ATP-binding cassette domain-containing protein [Rikenellaceae bacterium]
MIIKLENVAIARNPNFEISRNNREILKNINLEICRGELVYLIGKVGSGKSTFIKALYGEIAITKGRAHIVGYNLRNIKRKDIPYMRRSMGMVIYEYPLLPDRNVYANLKTILEATSSLSPERMRKRVLEVLNIVGMANMAKRMPYQLSSGEQQRVTIARAFLNSPELIIADEPTANLDPTTSAEIIKIFKDLSKRGCAVLLSTHDVSIIADNPSRTLRCEGGVIEEIDIFSILDLNRPEDDSFETHHMEENIYNSSFVEEKEEDYNDEEDEEDEEDEDYEEEEENYKEEEEEHEDIVSESEDTEDYN